MTRLAASSIWGRVIGSMIDNRVKSFEIRLKFSYLSLFLCDDLQGV